MAWHLSLVLNSLNASTCLMVLASLSTQFNPKFPIRTDFALKRIIRCQSLTCIGLNNLRARRCPFQLSQILLQRRKKKKRIVMCTVDLETVCDIRRKEVSGNLSLFYENGKFRLSILDLVIGIARIVSPLAFRSQGGIRPEVANSPTETVDPGT